MNKQMRKNIFTKNEFKKENNNTQNNENCGCKFYESCPRCFNTLTIGGFKCGTEIPGGYDVFKRDL